MNYILKIVVKQYLLAILLLLLPHFGWSYYQDITNNTPEGIKHNLSKIIENPDFEPAEALKNIEKIILNAEQERDKLKLHIGLIAKGQLLVKNNQPDDALIVLNAAYVNAMELGLEHHQNEAIRMLSEVHLWKELRIESQEYLHKGLVLSQILKDTLNTAWYFVNIVRVEQETGNIGRAMELALKAKSFFELTFDTLNQALIMLELSSIQNNSSQNCLNNANWFIRSKNISSLRGDILLAQSELYLLMGKVEEALVNCEKSIEIFKTIDNARLFAAMSLLGEIYTQLNHYNQGEDILKKP